MFFCFMGFSTSAASLRAVSAQGEGSISALSPNQTCCGGKAQVWLSSGEQAEQVPVAVLSGSLLREEVAALALRRRVGRGGGAGGGNAA